MQEPQLEVELSQYQQQYLQTLAAWRQNQVEKSSQDRQITEVDQDPRPRDEVIQAYQKMMRQQDESLRERQESSDYRYALTNRRRAMIQRLQERSQAEINQQQQATSEWLRMEGVRLRREARQLSGASGPDLDP